MDSNEYGGQPHLQTLHIFLVRPTDPDLIDSFCVVRANTAQEARLMHPLGPTWKWRENQDTWLGPGGATPIYWDRPEALAVTHLGTAAMTALAGVVCCSVQDSSLPPESPPKADKSLLSSAAAQALRGPTPRTPFLHLSMRPLAG